MSKHTPTPWKLGDLKEDGSRSISGTGWADLASVWTLMDGDERECKDGLANAHLIIRAVNAHDQYESLLRRWCAVDAGFDNDRIAHSRRELKAETQAALNKATTP